MIEMNNEKQYEQLRLDRQLCFPLYVCARQVVNRYTPYLRPLGLTYTQYIVFMVLWEKDCVTVGEIGKRLMLDNGTLTPMLKKLEAQGYISRCRCSDDERVVRINLTQKGWDLRERVKDIPAKMAECCTLTQEELETVYRILYKLLGDYE